jgi:hypothetical protein
LHAKHKQALFKLLFTYGASPDKTIYYGSDETIRDQMLLLDQKNDTHTVQSVSNVWRWHHSDGDTKWLVGDALMPPHHTRETGLFVTRSKNKQTEQRFPQFATELPGHRMVDEDADEEESDDEEESEEEEKKEKRGHKEEEDGEGEKDGYDYRRNDDDDMTDNDAEKSEEEEDIPVFSSKRPFLPIAKRGKAEDDQYYSDDDDSENYASSPNSDDDFQMGER